MKGFSRVRRDTEREIGSQKKEEQEESTPTLPATGIPVSRQTHQPLCPEWQFAIGQQTPRIWRDTWNP